MRYYILKENSRISNKPVLAGISKYIDVFRVKKSEIQFIDKNPAAVHLIDQDRYDFVDFISDPVPLISGQMKDILDDLEIKNVFYKPVVLTNQKKKLQKIYWLLVPRRIDCLAEESVVEGNISMGNLIIDTAKTGYYKIFNINNIPEDYIIIDEDLVSLFIFNKLRGLAFEELVGR